MQTAPPVVRDVCIDQSGPHAAIVFGGGYSRECIFKEVLAAAGEHGCDERQLAHDARGARWIVLTLRDRPLRAEIPLAESARLARIVHERLDKRRIAFFQRSEGVRALLFEVGARPEELQTIACLNGPWSGGINPK